MSDHYNQRWVSALFREPRWAVTVGGSTFYSCGPELVTTKWRLHENCHKAQWRRGLYVGFAVAYLYYHFTRGYIDNPYEVEARAASEARI